MMICEKVAKMLHEQVGNELGASHEYLATAVFFGELGLDGWAAEFYRQSDEERMHAMKIIRFTERRQRDVIERIFLPCGLWEGPIRTLASARALLHVRW